MTSQLYRSIDVRKLQHEMDIRGLDRRGLAAAANVSYQTVYKIFAGKRVCTTTLRLISDALGRVPAVGGLVSIISD